MAIIETLFIECPEFETVDSNELARINYFITVALNEIDGSLYKSPEAAYALWACYRMKMSNDGAIFGGESKGSLKKRESLDDKTEFSDKEIHALMLAGKLIHVQNNYGIRFDLLPKVDTESNPNLTLPFIMGG